VRRPTIADIAERAGVSKVAVSYALNDRPGVSAETRALIKRIATEIGWRPNSAAKALNGARARSVGLALARPARTLAIEPFFMELVSGIESVLSPHSFALTLQVVDDHAREIETYHRWWGERRVDGVIVVDLHLGDERIAELQGLDMPAVVVGHPDAAGDLTAVWSDDAEAIRETVSYLYALGHRRIARVAGLPRLVHTRLRDDAFTAVCEELGITGHPIVHTDYTGEEGARATRRVISSPTPPTAIVYDNDIMAVAGLSVAQEMRLNVPADFSIVAWDDSPFSRVVRPALTALTRDIPAYGAHAARTLLSLLDGETITGYQDEAARLTPRASTAPPPDRPA
jgi:DNA-binding LacI/PurR family transcriptional regulator